MYLLGVGVQHIGYACRFFLWFGHLLGGSCNRRSVFNGSVFDGDVFAVRTEYNSTLNIRSVHIDVAVINPL